MKIFQRKFQGMLQNHFSINSEILVKKSQLVAEKLFHIRWDIFFWPDIIPLPKLRYVINFVYLYNRNAIYAIYYYCNAIVHKSMAHGTLIYSTILKNLYQS